MFQAQPGKQVQPDIFSHIRVRCAGEEIQQIRAVRFSGKILYDVVVKKFTFAISSPDENLVAPSFQSCESDLYQKLRPETLRSLPHHSLYCIYSKTGFIRTITAHSFVPVSVLYQVLNKQVPVPVPVPVPNLQVPVPVQVLCINYRHSYIAVAQSKSCGIFHI